MPDASLLGFVGGKAVAVGTGAAAVAGQAILIRTAMAAAASTSVSSATAVAIYPPASCGNCDAFYPRAGKAAICRRFPPAPLFGAHFNQPGSGIPKAESFFPEVSAADWCREFKQALP